MKFAGFRYHGRKAAMKKVSQRYTEFLQVYFIAGDLNAVGPEAVGLFVGFDGEARKTLLTHVWPGNVRELRQKIMGAVLQAQTGLVTKEHLELAVTKPTSPVSFALRNDAEDKERILRALKQANGNRKVAAELLGIGRTMLSSK